MNEPRAIDNNTLLGEICTLLSQGKKVKLRAKGNSMRPFIHGSEDILVLAPSGTLHKEDVVLARIDGQRYVVHRIVGLNDDKVTLMGDGNLYRTEKCSKSDIFGTVECVIRKGKEYSIVSLNARFSAKVWRLILPLRRLKFRISNKIIRK